MKELSSIEMEVATGGMPCWAAKLSLITAGVLFTFGTGGSGLLLVGGLVGLGFAEWGYLESCFPQLLDQ